MTDTTNQGPGPMADALAKHSAAPGNGNQPAAEAAPTPAPAAQAVELAPAITIDPVKPREATPEEKAANRAAAESFSASTKTLESVKKGQDELGKQLNTGFKAVVDAIATSRQQPGAIRVELKPEPKSAIPPTDNRPSNGSRTSEMSEHRSHIANTNGEFDRSTVVGLVIAALIVGGLFTYIAMKESWFPANSNQQALQVLQTLAASLKSQQSVLPVIPASLGIGQSGHRHVTPPGTGIVTHLAEFHGGQEYCPGTTFARWVGSGPSRQALCQ